MGPVRVMRPVCNAGDHLLRLEGLHRFCFAGSQDVATSALYGLFLNCF